MVTFTPRMFGPEFDVALQQAGEQVAYHALTKGAMNADEQWEYVITQWPMLNTMAVDKVLRYAFAAIRAKFDAPIQSGVDHNG